MIPNYNCHKSKAACDNSFSSKVVRSLIFFVEHGQMKKEVDFWEICAVREDSDANCKGEIRGEQSHDKSSRGV
jgi:hypothetical protein